MFAEARAVITNGIRQKILYDCKRGLRGLFVSENDDPTKAVTAFVRGGFVRDYVLVCRKVTNELPYEPQ
jgi:hypothetical protein